VIGETPGLEVWNKYSRQYFAVERSYEQPAATVLAGRELEFLTNGRYVAGGHIVNSYPDLPVPSLNSGSEGLESPDRSRYSIVFVLRAHSTVEVNTDILTNSFTGPFPNPLKGLTAKDLFMEINRRHFNINTHQQEREEQRRKLAEQKAAVAKEGKEEIVGQEISQGTG
jgi:hypothetical protein